MRWADRAGSELVGIGGDVGGSAGAACDPALTDPPVTFTHTTQLAGKFGRWRFDKRTYATRAPPRHLGPPPKGAKNDMVRALVSAINEATAAIPCWDEYARTGTAPRPCEERVAADADGFKYID